MSEGLKIYFAGSLFNHKDLTGNALLAAHLELVSDGKYQCVLPQNIEFASGRSIDIRDQDIKALLECDLALFNFDGTELDSGTVVEFMFAKFFDMPSVIFRSDFRHAGDQDAQGDPWNLMCSGYPRAEKLAFNAMELYQNSFRNSSNGLEKYYMEMAKMLFEAFEKVIKEPPVSNDPEELEKVFSWGIKIAGKSFAKHLDSDFVKKAVERKKKNKLI